MAKQPPGPSLVIQRTINIAGRKTSVSLEDAFWKGLKEIAATKGVPVTDLISKLHTERQNANLSSAIRLFVLEYYRGKV
jgi:predicted DNA-binding ribbon-helix-helix protein